VWAVHFFLSFKLVPQDWIFVFVEFLPTGALDFSVPIIESATVSEGRALPAGDPKAHRLYFLLGIYLFHHRCSGLQFSTERAGKAAILPQDSVSGPCCLHVFGLR
jgi:hypothetical protein